MARKRKAVDSGSTGKQPKRSRQSGSADVADSNDAGASGSAMSSANTKPKRNPRRVAKDRWEEEKLMISTTSQLIDIDLVKLLAQPEAWECLEENEKEEILNLLPDNIHPTRDSATDDPDAKIPPLPESFLRYSNSWRDSIRQFQQDLQSGRYDPEWLRQAHEAMREREAGKFDKFKEDEFEEFWGQKQKMDKTLTAGQSSQVKLSTLIEHGVIRPGDVWKYSRVFANGGNKILIEKEARILEIKGSRLTFAVPPGQRVFLSAVQPSTKPSSPASSEAKDDKDTTSEVQLTDTAKENGEVQGDFNWTTKARKRESEPELGSRKKHQPGPTPHEGDPQVSSADDDVVLIASPEGDAVEAGNPLSEAEPSLPTTSLENTQVNCEQAEDDRKASLEASQTQPTSDQTIKEASPSEQPSDGADQTSEIILPNVRGLQALSVRIVEVDGRIQEVPNGNAWKEFRSYRDNQDMGSLWEIRQAWYLKTK